MNSFAAVSSDARERHMQAGGLNGFSLREIAVETGVKSSSVHGHFPTKESLVAAVVRRYARLMSGKIDRQIEGGADPIQVWAHIIGNGLPAEDDPSAVVGASARRFTPEIAAEVHNLSRMYLDKLLAEGCRVGVPWRSFPNSLIRSLSATGLAIQQRVAER